MKIETTLAGPHGRPNWAEIDTVLLDMDGTLLDLHFDNHFWLRYVPERFAERHGLSPAEGHAECFRRYDAVAGTLNWYCVDYWTEALSLDIAQLKEEVAHLIAVHPAVPAFLTALRATGRRTVMVTNAHHKSLALKMRHTGLAGYFDALYTSHAFGLAKESPAFWSALRQQEPFDPARTLLIDDSLPVLDAARAYGIAHLWAVFKPDTQLPIKAVGEYPAVRHFSEIMPI